MTLNGFASDNRSGVHPRMMKALESVNEGHASSYEEDEASRRAKDILKKHFGPDSESFFVFNGTAANVLAVRALCDSWHSVLCTDASHLWNHEGGAPEALTGCKLVAVPSRDGKLSLESLKGLLGERGNQHASQPRLISLTQPTELGTLYSLEEIRAICAWAHQEGLLVHVDGSRLVNAAAALGVGLGALTTELGVDAVSLGGTKNGLMFGEAVVFLKPGLALAFPWLRKQNLQLASKTRFLAAQFEAWLGGDLWREIAQHSNLTAQRLERGLREVPGVEISRATETNAVFARVPAAWIEPLRKTAPFYVWDTKTSEIRLMVSWDTRPSDVDAFVSAARALARA